MSTRIFIRALIALLVSLGAIAATALFSGATSRPATAAAPSGVSPASPASAPATSPTCSPASQSGVVPAGCYQYEIDVIPSFLANDPANRAGLGQGVGDVTIGGGQTLRCLNPGDANSGSCRYVADLPVGSTVSLTEQPQSLGATASDPVNSAFDRWGGACTGTGGCSFKLTADHMSVQAYFVPKLVTLTVNDQSASGFDSGEVSIAPTQFGGIPAYGNITCGSQPGNVSNFPCTDQVRLDDTLRLGAAKTSSLVDFSQWTGDPCTVVDAFHCRIFMDANHTVTAYFVSYASEPR